MTLRRTVRRAAGLLALTLAAFAAPTATGAERQSTEQGWTGTISVDVRGSGPMLPSGDGAKIRFEGQETTTYSLRGDGTASWTSSYTSRFTTPYYAIPTTGSGGGQATADVTFSEDHWSLDVDPIDTYDIRTDYTDRNAVHFEKGIEAFFIEVAKEMFKTPSPSPVQIDTEPHDPTGVSTGARGAANATTLSGSTTFPSESNHIGGFNGVPANVTVRWNLTRGPVSRRVQIYGSECGCMTNDETEKSLTFTAGASPAGGEFSEFVVTSTGKMPEIVSNEGGARPSLALTGTKDTGEVTLKITYIRNGVKTTSAPFTVNFCAIEKIELADDEHDIAFDDFDRLRVDAKAKAWRGGKEISKELEWQLEEMGAPTSLDAQPSSKKNGQIRFEYHGLPSQNSDFGRKKLTARVGGACACQRDEYVRTFFNPEDNNHPGGDAPNWYYYWKQLTHYPSGARPIMRFAPVITGRNIEGTPAAQYEAELQLMFLSPEIITPNGCLPRRSKSAGGPPHPLNGEHAQGIDCFIEDVTHEWQHRNDAVAWWGSPAGASGVSGAEALLRDPDLDNVPNDVEEAHGCSRFSKTSCPERPIEILSDAEIFAYWTGWSWKLGSADKEDWSCGPLAKQWKGKKCGQ